MVLQFWKATLEPRHWHAIILQPLWPTVAPPAAALMPDTANLLAAVRGAGESFLGRVVDEKLWAAERAGLDMLSCDVCESTG
jgi:hypothetical protein